MLQKTIHKKQIIYNSKNSKYNLYQINSYVGVMFFFFLIGIYL